MTKESDITIQDKRGKSVLHLCCACGHVGCLHELVSHSPQPVIQTLAHSLDIQGASVLHWACYNGIYPE